MAVTTDEDEAINFVFPDINDIQDCSQRAIITGTSHVVDALNSKILARLQGHKVSLFSMALLCSDETRLTNLLSTEFLNSLKSPGVDCQSTPWQGEPKCNAWEDTIVCAPLSFQL